MDTPEARSHDRSAYALVADDEPELANLLKEFLESRGLWVKAVGTLADARRHGDLHETDLVLLDLVLPDGSGELLLQDLGARPGPPPTS